MIWRCIASAFLAVVLLGCGEVGRIRIDRVIPEGVVEQGGVYFSEIDGMELVPVGMGNFQMGSHKGAFDEQPVHRVQLSPFFIDRFEVSNVQFETFVTQSHYEPEGPWRRSHGPGRENQPQRFVSWNDAMAYANWAGRTLPTEAQWEMAARGVESTTYPWGNAWEEGRARAGVGLNDGPVDVGSFPSGASPSGALDMAGNVWEWVGDWYDRNAYQRTSERRSHTIEDPLGPPDGASPELRFVESGTAAGNERSTRKVIRGGGWVEDGSENLRTSKRAWGNPRAWFNDTGFRCAIAVGDRA